MEMGVHLETGVTRQGAELGLGSERVDEVGFSVKKAYIEIVKRRSISTHDGRRDFTFLSIWNSIAPFKAKTMMWRLVWNRLPTIDNLRKRFAIPEEEWRCGCCREVDESNRHLFLECPEVQAVWYKILQWCGICWASPRSIRDHFISFSKVLGGGKMKTIMGGLWIFVVWVLWKWRNAFKFEHKDWNFSRIEEEIKCRFWSWCLVKGEADPICSFETWSCCRLSDMWPRA